MNQYLANSVLVGFTIRTESGFETVIATDHNEGSTTLWTSDKYEHVTETLYASHKIVLVAAV